MGAAISIRRSAGHQEWMLQSPLFVLKFRTLPMKHIRTAADQHGNWHNWHNWSMYSGHCWCFQRFSTMFYPLVILRGYWKLPSRNSGRIPIKNGGSFHSYVSLPGRVSQIRHAPPDPPRRLRQWSVPAKGRSPLARRVCRSRWGRCGFTVGFTINGWDDVGFQASKCGVYIYIWFMWFMVICGIMADNIGLWLID